MENFRKLSPEMTDSQFADLQMRAQRIAEDPRMDEAYINSVKSSGTSDLVVYLVMGRESEGKRNMSYVLTYTREAFLTKILTNLEIGDDVRAVVTEQLQTKASDFAKKEGFNSGYWLYVQFAENCSALVGVGVEELPDVNAMGSGERN